MNELNSISLNDFVALADVIWVEQYMSVKTPMRNSGIFKVVNIPQNQGDTRNFKEIDSNEFMSFKGEGDQATRGKVAVGYNKNMTAYRISENIGITYEMRTRNKYPEVISTLTNGARKGPQSMELDLTHRLTFATATTYTDRDGRVIDITVGDGLALASSVHTLTQSSTTYRNQLANNPQLSKGALEGMERLITEQTFNNFGEKMTMEFDILWTTDDANVVNTAREYLQSTADVEGAHSGIVNVYNGKYRHIILPRLASTAAGGVDTTKRSYWGIASSEGTTAYLGIWEETHLIPPSAGSNAEDVQTDNWDFRVRAGYGIAIVSGRGIKISLGDGSA